LAQRVTRGLRLAHAQSKRGRGLGHLGTSTVQQQAGDITSAGSSITTALNSSSTAVQIGSAIASGADVAALFVGPAGPIVAAIGNALGSIISMFHGCGSTCTRATAIANQVGSAMTTAFNAYMNAPVHYYSTQQAFIAYFQQLMSALNQSCGNAALGQAGKNCISENSQSACQWKASPGGWSQNGDGTWRYTYWGANGSGGACWNPWTGIYNMVANDPTVVADGTVTSGGNPVQGSNYIDFATPIPVAQSSTTGVTANGSTSTSPLGGSVSIAGTQIPVLALVGVGLLIFAVAS
jgi:hypothetical protein